ncbi:uncharacterized protein [Phaseolus vulgaris]|uniref:uncharacterized protein n=1 Tax=Phaseolus vulgaris TaxID=3885 RepID=UPI0035C95239
MAAFENGQQCGDKEVVKDKVKDFFKFCFDEEVGVPVRLDNACFNSISDEDNEMLVRVISKEEVKLVVWSCDSSKSPGPDDFNFDFMKFCWDFLKKDIITTMNEFAIRSYWPRGSNVSFICLIPKVDNPQQLMFVLVNESPTKEFHLKRGLCQGDPVVPFLFLILVKGLACVSRKAVDKKIKRNFLWGWGSKGRKITWVFRKKVYEPRKAGGLGILDLRLFNDALLGKWIDI